MAIMIEALTLEEAEAGIDALEFAWEAGGAATDAEEALYKKLKHVVEMEKR